ncbi:hypothetical protein G7046_g3764 [Stylonectria norvegica]|nr:hypothetical protein G7046_g3764 [Stylonectria norvegica]
MVPRKSAASDSCGHCGRSPRKPSSPPKRKRDAAENGDSQALDENNDTAIRPRKAARTNDSSKPDNDALDNGIRNLNYIFFTTAIKSYEITNSDLADIACSFMGAFTRTICEGKQIRFTYGRGWISTRIPGWTCLRKCTLPFFDSWQGARRIDIYGTWAAAPCVLAQVVLSKIATFQQPCCFPSPLSPAATMFSVMDLSGIDEDSLRLVIQLQQDDLEEILSSSACKGKEPEGTISDTITAIDACRGEFAAIECLLSDRKMCLSIAEAVKWDGQFIDANMVMEDQIARDRQLAAVLEEGQPTPSATQSENNNIMLDDELLDKLEALYVGSTENLTGQPESSAWAAGRVHPTSKCISCHEQHSFFDLARCPCSHEYCRSCLTTLFEACIEDESLFPPRCCKMPIPIEENRIFLRPNVVGVFKAKQVELDTPNRTYCHEKTCSTFVPVQFIKDDVAHCVKCQSTTCCVCKGPSHRGDCPHDEATQELERLAVDNHWQRCFSCGRIVELNHGCHHITCRCGGQFCYLCGMQWKQCACDEWAPARLRARARSVVERDGNQVREAMREELIQREMEHLEQNHECNHVEWRFRGGRHECEECNDMLPNYVFDASLNIWKLEA